MIRGKKAIASQKRLCEKKIKRLLRKENVNPYVLGYCEGMRDGLQWVLRKDRIWRY